MLEIPQELGAGGQIRAPSCEHAAEVLRVVHKAQLLGFRVHVTKTERRHNRVSQNHGRFGVVSMTKVLLLQGIWVVPKIRVPFWYP